MAPRESPRATSSRRVPRTNLAAENRPEVTGDSPAVRSTESPKPRAQAQSVTTRPAIGRRPIRFLSPLVALLFVAFAGRAEEAGSPEPPPLPPRLADTG